MKKINLILCACALAGSAFFASCKNNAQEINFVTTTSYTNYYTISGTYQEVEADSYISAAGVASTSNETTTTIKTLTSGYATISWTDSEVLEGNVSNEYSVNFTNERGTTQSKTDVGSVAGTLAPANPEEGSATIPNFVLSKIDGEFFYRTADRELVKATVTGDLESGEDFSIELSYKNTEDNISGPIAATSKEVNETTTTTTYKIDFKAQ